MLSKIPSDVKGEKSHPKTKKCLRELRLKTADVLIKLNATYKPFSWTNSRARDSGSTVGSLDPNLHLKHITEPLGNLVSSLTKQRQELYIPCRIPVSTVGDFPEDSSTKQVDLSHSGQ